MHTSRPHRNLASTAAFLLIVNLVIHSQQFNFRHLTIGEGLSHGSVYCIIQDRTGFMWFGTQDGLNRYDGYEFKTYRSDPKNKNSLSHNWIWDIFEDKESNLWIATWHGLTVYHPDENRFIRFLPDSTSKNSISGDRPSSICQDKNGYIWIAMWGGGLNRYDPATGKFRVFLFDTENKNSIPGNFVRKLFYDSKDRLWIGTWEGLAVAEIKDDKDEDDLNFHRFINQNNDNTSISCNQIMTIIEDHSGSIWIGTRGGGVNKFMENDSTFKRYTYDKNKPNTISNNDVCSMFEDNKHQIWIGTFTEGLNLFDTEKGTAIRIEASPDNPDGLLKSNVYCISEDRSGLLWVGAGGLNILDTRANKFGKYTHNNESQNSLNNNNVTGFYEDVNGNVWIATDGGGLNRLDRKTGVFSNYEFNSNSTSSIRSNSISDIAGNGTGKIWLATGEGLDVFDIKKDIFRHIHSLPGVNFTNGRLRYISDLCFSSADHLWIATDNMGIIRYDISRENTIIFNTKQKGKRYFPANSNLSLFYGTNNKLWVGTWGIGLYSIDLITCKIKAYNTNPKDPGGRNGNIVNSIYETTDSTGNTIWIGTNYGLLSMQPDSFDKAGFHKITIEDGLPGNIVLGILQDNSGYLWISTNSGLSRYDIKKGILRNYGLLDGIQGKEFNLHSCLKLKDGSLLFGGVDGFNMFDPAVIKECTYQSPVVLTGFQIFNKDITFNKQLSKLKKIDLSYKQNFFSFEFAALDFGKPSETKYSYRMKGVDPDWVNSGTRRYVSYTNVSPGKYLFQVKATNRDGIVSNKELSLNIKITPPYWQTWWFRSLIILAVLLLLYGLHRLRLEKLLAIEKLRVRIASDLHDDIGSSLTRISITSEQIQNIKDTAKIQTLSKRIGITSREIISTMSDIVWSIDARNDTWGDLLDRMHDLVYKNIVMKEIKVSFKASGLDKNKKISVDNRQNLFYIFKETINNIIKHSGATEVLIILNNDKSFMMEISDNGKSFDPGKIRQGNGLRNMQMRAKRLNAKIDISSDNGVKIKLVMKKF